MDCVLCGKKFGIVARITGDSDDGVCRACEEKGRSEMEALVAKVGPDCDFAALAEQMDAVAAKYRVQRSGARHRLLAKIFSAASVKAKISPADVGGLNGLLKKWPLLDPPDGQIMDAVGIINARSVIENWNPADPPTVKCGGLLLQTKETCHWEEEGRMYEQRTRRQYVGASQGISIPLGHGLRYRVGGFAATPLETKYLADCGPGRLHITSQRVCFCGDDQSVSIPWKKVINISLFADSLAVHRSGAKRASFIGLPHPDLTARIMALASPAQND